MDSNQGIHSRRTLSPSYNPNNSFYGTPTARGSAYLSPGTPILPSSPAPSTLTSSGWRSPQQNASPYGLNRTFSPYNTPGGSFQSNNSSVPTSPIYPRSVGRIVAQPATKTPECCDSETRILIGQAFCFSVGILFCLIHFYSHFWIMSALSCAIFYYLWTIDKPNVAIVLASLMISSIILFGSLPATMLEGEDFISRSMDSKKVHQIHIEELVLDLTMPFEKFDSNQFLDDICNLVDCSKDTLKVKIRDFKKEQTTFSLVLQIQKGQETRLTAREVKSVIEKGLMTNYRIKHVVIIKEHEYERPKPAEGIDIFKGWSDDDILGGGATVEVLYRPTITVSGGGTICEGEMANITFTMTGTGPWTIVYNEGPPSFKVHTIENVERSPYIIQTDRPGHYALGLPSAGGMKWQSAFKSMFEKEPEPTDGATRPKDNYCDAILLAGHADVVVHPVPSAEFARDGSRFGSRKARRDVLPPKDSLCEGQRQNLQVSLTGTPPWTLTYSILFGDSEDDYQGSKERFQAIIKESNIHKSPFIIEAEQSGEYQLLNITDAHCQKDLTRIKDIDERYVSFVWIKGLPKGQITGGKCSGDDILVTLMSGSPPWSLEYKYDGKPFVEKDIMQTTHRIQTEGDCQNPGSHYYIFEKVNDRFCNGAIKDGPITIKPLPMPKARIHGGGAVLEGKTIDLTVDLDGIPPWSFSYSVEDSGTYSEHVVTDVFKSPYVLKVSQKGKYRITSVSDAQCGRGCASGVSTVTLYHLPTGEVKLSKDSFCRGQDSPSLQFFIKGAPPFNIQYTLRKEDGSEKIFVEKGIMESPWITKATSPGTYTFTSITDGYDNSVALRFNNIVNLRVAELPYAEWTAATQASICEGEKVMLGVQLTGVPPWSITYTDGRTTHTETGVTSSPYVIPITSEGNYRILRVDDRYCPNWLSQTQPSKQSVVSITKKTPPHCSIYPPRSTNLESCVGDAVTVRCTGTPPFKLVYFNGARFTTKLSDTNEFIIHTNTTGKYSFSEVYDASECKGKILGSDHGPTTLLVHDRPTATLSSMRSKLGDCSICPGEGVDLSLTLTGNAPWTVTYSYRKTKGGHPAHVKITGITQSPYRFVVKEDGFYSLVSVVDAHCETGTVTTLPSGCGAQDDDEVQLAYHALPQATFASATSRDKICEGDDIKIQLTGTPPFSLSYSIIDLHNTNHTRVEDTIHDNPLIIPARISGTYILNSVSDSKCSNVASGAIQVMVYPMPRAYIGGGGTVCVGDKSEITVDLTGTPPFTISYMNLDDGTSFTEKSIQYSTHIIQTDKAGTYQLVAISDANCHYERHKKK